MNRRPQANGDDAIPMPRGRRAIPSVEKVLQALGEMGAARPVAVAIVRRELAALRREPSVPEFGTVLLRIRSALNDQTLARIQPVINGTGIILHTNLGRAPLSDKAIEAMSEAGRGYSNVEFDLVKGERGSRAPVLEQNLALLCEAEAAAVVNNCAAALVLVLRQFTREKRQVLISRGELVQIGGGFRIPDILEASGAELREVGTTNQTSLEDYARAISPQTGLILKVHRSNFTMSGFVSSASTAALAALAREENVPLVEDLGSGALIATEQLISVPHEPTPAEVLRQGADLTTFSGDKLLGGPQAGIIAGRADYIGALKRNPIFRALRCDKLILCALETTIESYLNGTAAREIPTLALLQVSCDTLCERAEAIQAMTRELPLDVRVTSAQSQVGGGTLPGAQVESVCLELLPHALTLHELSLRLRRHKPSIIGCLSSGSYHIDLRTVFPRQDEQLVAAIRAAFND